MGILGTFRDLVGTLQRIAAGLTAISGRLAALMSKWDAEGQLASRVEDLELTQAKWQAEVEAILLKAESVHKAARGAEARERQLKKANERDFGVVIDESEEGSKGLPAVNATGGNAEGMQPVHEAVEVDPRRADRERWQALVRSKYL